MTSAKPDWLIATPAWGARCVGRFIDYALPAIRAAAQRIGGRVRFVVHTDEPSTIAAALGNEHTILPVPDGQNVHQSAAVANREALQLAEPGECVAFINADMVASVEVFEAAQRRFAQGKRLIMMAASRTAGENPPIGASSADVLRWAMAHRHPAIAECFWGSGRSVIPWAVYFEQGDEIVLHGFHLHPFAIMKDRDLGFAGTIDWDLGDNYREDEIHLITDKDEAAFAEMSPPERTFPLLDAPFDAKYVASWARSQASPLHCWMFQHRIVMTGTGADLGDEAVTEQVLRLL